jgi:hypothetical protein
MNAAEENTLRTRLNASIKVHKGGKRLVLEAFRNKKKWNTANIEQVKQTLAKYNANLELAKSKREEKAQRQRQARQRNLGFAPPLPPVQNNRGLLRKVGGVLYGVPGMAGRAAKGAVGAAAAVARPFIKKNGTLGFTVNVPTVYGAGKKVAAVAAAPKEEITAAAANSLTTALGLNENSKVLIQRIEKDIYEVLTGGNTPNIKKKIGERIGQNLAQVIVRYVMLPNTGPGKFSNAKKGILSKNGLAKNWQKVYFNSGAVNRLIGNRNSAVMLKFFLSEDGREIMKKYGSNAVRQILSNYSTYSRLSTLASGNKARIAASQVPRALGYAAGAVPETWPRTKAAVQTLAKYAPNASTLGYAAYAPGYGTLAGAAYTGLGYLPPSYKNAAHEKVSALAKRIGTTAKNAAAEQTRRANVYKRTSNNALGAELRERQAFFNKYPSLKNAKKWFNATRGLYGNLSKLHPQTAANAILNSRYIGPNNKKQYYYMNYNWRNVNTNGANLSNDEKEIVRILKNYASNANNITKRPTYRNFKRAIRRI